MNARMDRETLMVVFVAAISLARRPARYGNLGYMAPRY
jgi:hypothetical protein